MNPNVLWELGYSTALHKHVMVISDDSQNLPFNLRLVDVCKYEFSYKGILKLKDIIVERLRYTLVPLALREQVSLIRHVEFTDASKKVMSTLKRIKEDSLLKRLALNELTRIGKRFENLGKGLFELRNEKPYEEVIKYYCDYVSQLKGEDSGFDVVSNLNFWKEITDNGNDYRYILSNSEAARSGAKVKRIILIDATEFKGETVKNDSLYSTIFAKFYENNMQYQDNFQTKLLFSKNFKADRKSYGNFGILRQGTEILLFKPQYEDLRMRETAFIYFSRDRDRLSTDEHANTVNSYESKFIDVWDKAEPLQEKHFS